MRSALLVVLAACSGSGADRKDGSNTSDATNTAPTETDASLDSGSSDTRAIEPVWWSLQGALAVEGGIVDPALSVVEIALLDADESVVCVLSGAPLSVTDAPLPDPGLLTWWTLAPPVPYDACAAFEPFVIGVGPYDPLLDPGASAAAIDATNLNGLYTLSGDTLWVFGVAGAPAQFESETPALMELPLPDGELKLASLYLLPL